MISSNKLMQIMKYFLFSCVGNGNYLGALHHRHHHHNLIVVMKYVPFVWPNLCLKTI